MDCNSHNISGVAIGVPYHLLASPPNIVMRSGLGMMRVEVDHDVKLVQGYKTVRALVEVLLAFNSNYHCSLDTLLCLN